MAKTDAYNAWLVDRARPWLRGRVLDVGAGIGTHTKRLVEIADEVVTLEPDRGLAKLLRRRAPTATVVEGDIFTIGGTFDAITCFNVLEHIADDEAVLARFADLLAPNGTVCLIVPAHPFLFGPLDKAFGHERRYTSNDLRRKLEAAGLEPQRIQHVNAVGALGWLVQSRILRRTTLPRTGLSIYDRLVPILRRARPRPAQRRALTLGGREACATRRSWIAAGGTETTTFWGSGGQSTLASAATLLDSGGLEPPTFGVWGQSTLASAATLLDSGGWARTTNLRVLGSVRLSRRPRRSWIAAGGLEPPTFGL